MDPQIRFFTSFDGTRIAYADAGAGPPMVFTPVWNVWMEIQLAGAFGFPLAKLFARRQRVIVFDLRGAGASRADPASITLDAVVRDLAALVDHMQLDRFDLCGLVTTASATIAYAAAHPRRVRRLVLEAPAGSAAEKGSPEAVDAMAAYIRGNWRGAARTIAGIVLPSSAREDQHAYANLLYQAIPAEVAARYVEFDRDFDVRDLLLRIECPTIVLQYADRHLVPREATQAVASRIPDARLLTMPYLGEYPPQLFEFLGHPLAAGDAELEAAQLPSGTAVILFTDIAGSTALTERMGDAAFRAAARTLDERLRAAIRDAGGTPVEGKVLGDGVMAVFTSAREAIDAALRCHALSAKSELRLHLGIHAGDVIREPGNVYGGAVNIASRICALSEPGEVLVSDVVRGMARTSAGVVFEDRGEQDMKGVGEPVRVYAVRGKEDA